MHFIMEVGEKSCQKMKTVRNTEFDKEIIKFISDEIGHIQGSMAADKIYINK